MDIIEAVGSGKSLRGYKSDRVPWDDASGIKRLTQQKGGQY